MAKQKNPAAVALGRLGGKAAAGAGARKLWAGMTPEERSERMRAAVQKRWARERARKRAKKRKK